jgi:hypothetical protein
VADAERAAGQRVDRGAIGRAVIGDDACDAEAVALEERQCASEEADRGGGLLVAEDLGVGETRGVIDGDVNAIPADGVAPAAFAVGERPVVVLAAPITYAFARPALMRPSFLMSMWISSPGRARS